MLDASPTASSSSPADIPSQTDGEARAVATFQAAMDKAKAVGAPPDSDAPAASSSETTPDQKEAAAPAASVGGSPASSPSAAASPSAGPTAPPPDDVLADITPEEMEAFFAMAGEMGEELIVTGATIVAHLADNRNIETVVVADKARLAHAWGRLFKAIPKKTLEAIARHPAMLAACGIAMSTGITVAKIRALPPVSYDPRQNAAASDDGKTDTNTPASDGGAH